MPFDLTKLKKDFTVQNDNSKSDVSSSTDDDFTKHIKELLAKSHVEGANTSPTELVSNNNDVSKVPEETNNIVTQNVKTNSVQQPNVVNDEVSSVDANKVQKVPNNSIAGPGSPIKKEETLNKVGPGNVGGEKKKYQENEIDYSKELNNISLLEKAVDELPDVDNGKYNASVSTRASAVNTMDFTPNTSTSHVAKYYLKKAKDTYEQPQDTEKSFLQSVKDMGTTFLKGIGDWDYFTLGMYGAGASKGLTRLYDKMKNNPMGKPIEEILSEQEQVAIKAYLLSVQASQDRMDNVSVAGVAGDIAGRSLPYMLEFIATGGLEGATVGAQKAFMTYVAKNSPKILLNTKVGRGVIKFGTGLANKSLVTFARSGGMPSTYTNLTQAMSARNPDGTQVSLGKGLYSGLVDVYTNNISELYGEEIMKSAGILVKGLGKGTKAILPNKIKAAFSSNLSKKIAGTMGIVNKGNIFKLISGIKPLKEVSKLAGFHGLPGEVLEEYWGSALQSVLTADPSQFQDMFTVKNNMQLLTGFLPMQVFSMLTGIPTIARYSKAKQDVSKAQTTLTSFLIANEMDQEQAESFANSLGDMDYDGFMNTSSKFIPQMQTDEARKSVFNLVSDLLNKKQVLDYITGDGKSKGIDFNKESLDENIKIMKNNAGAEMDSWFENNTTKDGIVQRVKTKNGDILYIATPMDVKKDGTINSETTPASLLYYDEEGGVHQISPSQIDKVLVNTSYEEYKATFLQGIETSMRNENIGKEESNRMEGIKKGISVTYSIDTENGPKTGSGIVREKDENGQLILENGTIIPSESVTSIKEKEYKYEDGEEITIKGVEGILSRNEGNYVFVSINENGETSKTPMTEQEITDNLNTNKENDQSEAKEKLDNDKKVLDERNKKIDEEINTVNEKLKVVKDKIKKTHPNNTKMLKRLQKEERGYNKELTDLQEQRKNVDSNVDNTGTEANTGGENATEPKEEPAGENPIEPKEKTEEEKFMASLPLDEEGNIDMDKLTIGQGYSYYKYTAGEKVAKDWITNLMASSKSVYEHISSMKDQASPEERKLIEEEIEKQLELQKRLLAFLEEEKINIEKIKEKKELLALSKRAKTKTVFYKNDSELPEAIRNDKNFNTNAAGMLHRPKGGNKVIYINERFLGRGKSISTWLHELTHAGIVDLLSPKDYNKLMLNVYLSAKKLAENDEEIAKTVLFIENNYINASYALKGEELIAFLSSKLSMNEVLSKGEKSVWEEIVNFISDYLKKITGNNILTKEELTSLAETCILSQFTEETTPEDPGNPNGPDNTNEPENPNEPTDKPKNNELIHIPAAQEDKPQDNGTKQIGPNTNTNTNTNTEKEEPKEAKKINRHQDPILIARRNKAIQDAFDSGNYYLIPHDMVIEYLRGEGLNDETIDLFIKSKIAGIKAAIKKAGTAKVKKSESEKDFIQKLKEQQDEKENLNAQLSYWESLVEKIKKEKEPKGAIITPAPKEKTPEKAPEKAAPEKAPEKASEKPKKEKVVFLDKDKEVPDMSLESPKKARARGWRVSNGKKFTRQGKVKTVEGNPVAVKFANDESVPGHFTLVESENVQSSHKQKVRNPLFFIDEAQPKERTDDASSIASDKISRNINPEEITTGTTAYVGAPVINARGEVIQGNNRNDALGKAYENGTAKGYKEYLIKNAKKFGFKVEDVESMENPILTRTIDVEDEQAIKLGQRVSSDTESGGYEDIDANRTAALLGTNLEQFAKIIFDDKIEDERPNDAINRKGVIALQYLLKAKVINNTQYQSALNSMGRLTPKASGTIWDIINSLLFQNGARGLPQMFNILPVKAQVALSKTIFRTVNIKDKSIIKYIQEGIAAYEKLTIANAEFRSAKTFEQARGAIRDWLAQSYIGDKKIEVNTNRFSKFALKLAIAFNVLTQKEQEQLFTSFYEGMTVSSQTDAFDKNATKAKTIEEAYSDVFKNLFETKHQDILSGDLNNTKENEETGPKETKTIKDEANDSTNRQKDEGANKAIRQGKQSNESTLRKPNNSNNGKSTKTGKEAVKETKSSWGKNKESIESRRAAARKAFRDSMNDLNVGLNPKALANALAYGETFLEEGVYKFKDWITEIAKDLSENGSQSIKKFIPYLRAAYTALSTVDYIPDEVADEMNTPREIRNTNVEQIINEALNLKEENHDERKPEHSQPNSGENEIEKQKHKVDLSNDTGESSSMGRDTNDLLDVEDRTKLSDREEKRTSSESNKSDSSVNGEQRDNGIRGKDTRTEHEGIATRDTDNGRITNSTDKGKQQSIDFGGDYIDEANNKSNDADRALKEKQRARQKESDRIEEEQDTSLSPKQKIKLGEIKKQLPNLYYAQQKDVLFALNRFEVGKGVMFTNATGTGKTFTGLGIIKNFAQKGKKNALIVVPSDAKCGDWVKDGEKVGLHIRQLKDINDAGNGLVVTTYANFYQNKNLLSRANDLVMYDESQYIGQGQKGVAESYYEAHRQAVRLPSFVRATLWDKYPAPRPKDYLQNSASTVEYDKAVKARQEKIRQETIKEVNSVKVVYLSATPFAYHKNIKYADGTLFDIEEKLEEEESSWNGQFRGESYGAYNQAVGFDSFMQSHFGYRMRYNKLTVPKVGVDMNLMERQFYEDANKQGIISGRALNVDKDYSRNFVLLDSSLGDKINQGMDLFRSKDFQLRYPILSDYAIRQKWDYLYTNQLLESIKASMCVERVKAYLKRGMKVVIFHDYNMTIPSHPFIFNADAMKVSKKYSETARKNALRAEIGKFNHEYPELLKMNMGQLTNVRELYAKEFGASEGEFNGKTSKTIRKNNIKNFNNGNINVLMVQRKAGKEGISLHDEVGDTPRVLMDFGLPISPTDAIQTEGRIYRLNVASNAIFEYPVIRTNFEMKIFANKIAERVKTPENLAMGNRARNLEDAFRDGYNNADEMNVDDIEGIGGKEKDRSELKYISEFDRAKTYYYAKQKRTAKDKGNSGVDYFATPEPLGYKLFEWLHSRPGSKLLEPSAGDGAIARFFTDKTDNIFVEPNYGLGIQLQSYSNGELIQDDFENFYVGNKFEGIAMNPPFGRGGKTAVAHLEKAYNQLSDIKGGRVVAIIPEGPSCEKYFNAFINRQNPLVKREDKAYKHLKVVASIKLPSSTFNNAGTSASTRIVVIDKIAKDVDYKNNSTTDYYDFSDLENNEQLFKEIENLDIPYDDAERIKYQGLDAIEQEREEEEEEKEEQKKSDTSIVETSDIINKPHTRTGQMQSLVKITSRAERSEFLKLKQFANEAHGFYSKYNKAFTFENNENANNFINSIKKYNDSKDTEVKLEIAEDNINTSPTEAQKEAGNYKMGHVNLFGFDTTLENPKGSVRSGVDENGKKWSVKMNNTYGYIKGTKGKDGDQIDVFIGDNLSSEKVFVVDQVVNGKFDEHKVMLGFDNKEDAEKAYLANYDKDWQGLGDITGVSLDTFKDWINSSVKKTKEFKDYSIVKFSLTDDFIDGAKVQDVETEVEEGEIPKVIKLDNVDKYIDSIMNDKEFSVKMKAKSLSLYVRKNMSKDLIGLIGKQKFDQFVKSISDTLSKRDLKKHLTTVKGYIADVKMKQVKSILSTFINLQIQGVNSKNISIAKNVDETTRVLIRRFKDFLADDNLFTRAGEKIVEDIGDAQTLTQEQETELYALALYEQFKESVLTDLENVEDTKEATKDLINKQKELRKADKVSGTKENAEEIKALNEKINNSRDTEIFYKNIYIESGQEFAMKLQDILKGGASKLKDFIDANIARRQRTIRNGLKDVKGDLGVRSLRTNEDKANKKWFKAYKQVANVFTKYLDSFDHVIRMISRNALNGEGYLYHQFMLGKNGFINSSSKQSENFLNDIKVLDDKINELFGFSHSHLMKLTNKKGGIVLTINDNGATVSHGMTIGQELYVYAMSKMADTKEKLADMNIGDEDIEMITEDLQKKLPHATELMDWIQDEFLPERRKEYNQTHIDIFGTSMTKINHYFPSEIVKGDIYQKVEISKNATDNQKEQPSKVTGNIINRRRNSAKIQIHTNALELLYSHLNEMERWNAYVPIANDLDNLLSSKTFRNAVDANGYDNYKKLLAASNSLINGNHEMNDPSDYAIRKLAKAIALSKISFRLWTALKQPLSYFAFLSVSNNPKFLAQLANNIADPLVFGKNWNWCMENIPIFKKRVMSGSVGDEKLGQKVKGFLNQNKVIKFGMIPNALLDSFTISAGVMATYNFKREKYIKLGLDVEDAERIAKLDAVIIYNKTQQSAEGAFLSPAQLSRTVIKVIISTFNNTPFGYGRMLTEALKELPKNKEDIKEFEYNRLMDDGYNPIVSRKIADYRAKNHKSHAVKGVLMYGFALNVLFQNAGNLIVSLLSGGDDDKDLSDDLLLSAIVSPVSNFGWGGQVASIIEGYSPDTYFTSDLVSRTREYRNLWNETPGMQSAGYIAFDLAFAFGLAVDMESLNKITTSVYQMISTGEINATNISQFLAAPESVTKTLLNKRKEGETAEEYMTRLTDFQNAYEHISLQSKLANAETAVNKKKFASKIRNSNLNKARAFQIQRVQQYGGSEFKNLYSDWKDYRGTIKDVNVLKEYDKYSSAMKKALYGPKNIGISDNGMKEIINNISIFIKKSIKKTEK